MIILWLLHFSQRMYLINCSLFLTHPRICSLIHCGCLDCHDCTVLYCGIVCSMRSKDPSTQVGACIVDTRKRIVGIGYNGFPAGCSDDILPWARTADDELDTKYPYVVHAEVNAILNKNSSELSGCSVSYTEIIYNS
jgi:deoxycytidylate deaminase